MPPFPVFMKSVSHGLKDQQYSSDHGNAGARPKVESLVSGQRSTSRTALDPSRFETIQDACKKEASRYSHQPPFHFVSISNLARHGTLPTAKRDSIQTPFPTSQALGIKICNLSIRNLPTDGTSACLRYRISKPIIVGKPQRRRHGFQLSISSSPCFASFGSTI